MSVILSKYQQAITDEVLTGNGHIYIDAAAGSGKSFTITLIATHHIPQGMDAVFLAFNKHIVEALKKKLPPSLDCKTCHSMGYGPVAKALKRGRLNVDKFKYANKCMEVIKEYFPDLKWNEQKELSTQLSELVDFARNTLTDYKNGDDLVAMSFRYGADVKDNSLYGYVQPMIEWGIEHYQSTGEIDFIDMIWLVYALDLDVRKYDYVLVDETQDLNALQHYLLTKILKKTSRLIFVGDKKQSMYGFTGALSNSLQLLKDQFNAKKMPLSICYRCPKSHIRLARFVDDNRTEWKEDAIEGTVNYILLDEVATIARPRDLILCRLTAPLISLCIKFIAKGIGAKVLGRNIGKSLVTMIKDSMKPNDNDANPTWDQFMPRLETFRDGQQSRLGKMRNSDYQLEMLQDKFDAICACFKSPLFDSSNEMQFVRAIEGLFSDEAGIITLCTIHRAKGLEADRVFIVNDKEGKDCMPLIWPNQQDWEMEQELNIIYVALTRAKQDLFICSSSKEASARHKVFYETGGVNEYKRGTPVDRALMLPSKMVEAALNHIDDMNSLSEEDCPIPGDEFSVTETPSIPYMESFPKKKTRKKKTH